MGVQIFWWRILDIIGCNLYVSLMVYYNYKEEMYHRQCGYEEVQIYGKFRLKREVVVCIEFLFNYICFTLLENEIYESKWVNSDYI